MRISNALQFIQLEGAAISDETAAQILRDFTGDMEIMQRIPLRAGKADRAQ
ncbi:MAG: hypothetical protein ACLR1P_08315 [Oscillospiraceae bacterium]